MPGTVTLSPHFTRVSEEVKKVTQNPSNDDKLQLYGLYKEAYQAPFEAATKPGLFAFEEKYKYEAWEKVHKEGLSSAEAQKRYIALAEDMKKKYGYDPKKVVKK